jgi:hypothetical protein
VSTRHASKRHGRYIRVLKGAGLPSFSDQKFSLWYRPHGSVSRSKLAGALGSAMVKRIAQSDTEKTKQDTGSDAGFEEQLYRVLEFTFLSLELAVMKSSFAVCRKPAYVTTGN